MGVEDLGTLNLADADLSAGNFDPIPAAQYDMHVHNVEVVEIEKEGGKLPVGTPGYNVQFRVDGGKYNNRVVFKRFYLPTADSGYDEEKRKKALGIFVNFILAMGFSKEEVMSGDFQPDPQDWLGKEVKCSVSVQKADPDSGYSDQNNIGSIKPRSEAGSALESGAL